MNSKTLSSLPPACTSMAINYAGLGCFLLSIVLMRAWGPKDPFWAAVLGMGALAFPIIVLEWLILKTHRRTSTGLDLSQRQPWNADRLLVKLAGLLGTVTALTAAYQLFPEYHRPTYEPYWRLMWLLAPIVAIGAVPYFIWVDRRLAQPEDGYWQAGLAVLGRWRQVDRRALGQHALGWIVKGFFLPIMFMSLAQNMSWAQQVDLTRIFSEFDVWYEVCWSGLFTVDLVFVCVGYLLTLRIFDSHIRSTEPTLMGWAVALMCYEPFWHFTSSRYLGYDDGLLWSDWLLGHPPVQFVGWGVAILACLAVYVWASIPFGLRFSNLTHRGILTNGPYRFTKHPAYVSKNLMWWLVSIPFIPHLGVSDALQNCLRLALLNVVYYLRARTEERHLSRDPVYVAYALAMNERSIFRGAANLLPFLRYRPPAS